MDMYRWPFHVTANSEGNAQEINKNVVITIPMYFDGAQRHAMKKAAELANLGEIVMMPEANAVVMAHLVRSGICPL
ncbi:hypothetical protein B566_EDAN017058 [Ephemera danica]|nr:hypothetical protein B566_EDAN017058 [Ephemera danica]